MRFVLIFDDSAEMAVEVADRARAVALIEADPCFIACPRTYRLLAWGEALAHLQVHL